MTLGAGRRRVDRRRPVPTGTTAYGTGSALRALLRPVGWLTLGMVAVSTVYGFVGVLTAGRGVPAAGGM